MKAMALRPEDRYATPKALADDVERWMADEPVVGLAGAMDANARAVVDPPPHRRHRRRRRHAHGPGRAGGRLGRSGPCQWRTESRE